MYPINLTKKYDIHLVSLFARMQKLKLLILKSVPYILFLISLGIGMACSVHSIAQSRYKTQWSVTNDNDLYLLTYQDQYYTNGVSFQFRQARSPSSGSLLSRKSISTWTIGHKMYNAYSAQIDSIQAVDRPITSYIYAAYQVDYYRSANHVWNLHAELGMIGPIAQGKPLQEGLHNLFGMYAARGWEYQLKNAIGANVGISYSRRIRNFSNWGDWAFQTEGKLGTNNLQAGLQTTIRVGKLLDMMSSAHWGGQLSVDPDKADREWYFYYSPGIRVVGYDATIQGGLFNKDKGPVVGVPQPVVLFSQTGGVYTFKSWTLGAHFTFSTKETTRSFFRHQYGSMRLAYRY